MMRPEEVKTAYKALKEATEMGSDEQVSEEVVNENVVEDSQNTEELNNNEVDDSGVEPVEETTIYDRFTDEELYSLYGLIKEVEEGTDKKVYLSLPTSLQKEVDGLYDMVMGIENADPIQVTKEMVARRLLMELAEDIKESQEMVDMEEEIAKYEKELKQEVNIIFSERIKEMVYEELPEKIKELEEKGDDESLEKVEEIKSTIKGFDNAYNITFIKEKLKNRPIKSYRKQLKKEATNINKYYNKLDTHIKNSKYKNLSSKGLHEILQETTELDPEKIKMFMVLACKTLIKKDLQNTYDKTLVFYFIKNIQSMKDGNNEFTTKLISNINDVVSNF